MDDNTRYTCPPEFVPAVIVETPEAYAASVLSAQRAEHEGAIAFTRGAERADNPYHRHGCNHRRWLQGWRWAESYAEGYAALRGPNPWIPEAYEAHQGWAAGHSARRRGVRSWRRGILARAKAGGWLVNFTTKGVE